MFIVFIVYRVYCLLCLLYRVVLQGIIEEICLEISVVELVNGNTGKRLGPTAKP